MNTNWFFPYAEPTATNTILDDERYFNESMSPLFNNIKHPNNPQYRHESIAGETNHNMIEGQPEDQKKNLLSNYINAQSLTPKKESPLNDKRISEANIHWKTVNDCSKKDKYEYNPYKISPNFRALPDGPRNSNNPNKMTGPLTQIVPWNQIVDLNKDEYFNERNFKEMFNHPFYNEMKPFLEQPFKHL